MTDYDLPLPALTTSSVFAIRSSISIDAPKQKVWDILLDFASYKEWCVSTIHGHHRSLSHHCCVQEPIYVRLLSSPARLRSFRAPQLIRVS
jgi:hypothetical protein